MVMQKIFNYATIDTALEKSTRTLHVCLKETFLSTEFLFELETLLAWAQNRVEIHSIYFTSDNKYFSQGFDPDKLQKSDERQIKSLTIKLQRLILAMLCMPQTIVMNLKSGAFNIGAELSLGADIRLVHKDCELKFNHHQLGLSPACGAMSVLPQIISPALAKQWILTAGEISAESLILSGFALGCYDKQTEEKTISNILANIHATAAIARIQTKMGLNENTRELIEKQMEKEKSISNATLVAGDWKRKHSPMPAKSMSYSVKFSLIKNQEMLDTNEISH
jgi:enoyl-CoA hydratase/carnithine racemase